MVMIRLCGCAGLSETLMSAYATKTHLLMALSENIPFSAAGTMSLITFPWASIIAFG